MGIELREHHERLQAAVNERAKSLAERLLGICPIDGREAGSNGLCPVCRRVVTPPPSDEEISELDDVDKDPSPDAVKAAARRLFLERLARQRAEREEQARQQAKPRTHLRPEDEPRGRNWADVVDSNGRIRHW
jgi:hypothetical protein